MPPLPTGDFRYQGQGWPAKQPGNHRRSRSDITVDGLLAENHHVGISDFLNGGRQHSSDSLCVRPSHRWVVNQDRLAASHGQGMFNRFFGILIP